MTLVSHDQRFIFVRTRKTAGTSVEMYLQPYCTPAGTPVEEWGEAIISNHGIIGERLDKARRNVPPAHGVIRDEGVAHHVARGLKTHQGPEILKTHLKITAERHPFHKVLSGAFWRKRNAQMPKAADDRVRETVRQGHLSDDMEIVFVDGKHSAPRTVRRDLPKEGMA